MEAYILNDKEIAGEELLRQRIEKLANELGLLEIRYMLTFAIEPHFILTDNYDDTVKGRACEEFKRVFPTLKSFSDI